MDEKEFRKEIREEDWQMVDRFAALCPGVLKDLKGKMDEATLSNFSFCCGAILGLAVHLLSEKGPRS